MPRRVREPRLAPCERRKEKARRRFLNSPSLRRRSPARRRTAKSPPSACLLTDCAATAWRRRAVCLALSYQRDAETTQTAALPAAAAPRGCNAILESGGARMQRASGRVGLAGEGTRTGHTCGHHDCVPRLFAFTPSHARSRS